MYPYFGKDKGEHAGPQEYQAQYENYYLNDGMDEEAFEGYGGNGAADAFVFGGPQFENQPIMEARASGGHNMPPKGGMPKHPAPHPGYRPMPHPEHKPEHMPEYRPGHKPEHMPEYRPMPHPEHKPKHRPEHRPGHYPDYKPEHKPGYHPHPGKPQHPHGERPMGPPPHTIPKKTMGAGVYAVDPGAIRPCMYEYIYVWLKNGQGFWMYPTYIGPRSISGYRWADYGWVYAGFDLDYIESFYCMPY